MNPPYQTLYVTAARGIQDFIFRSDKLKEMVGASELVELLATNLMNQLLADHWDQDDYCVLSQAGGGARILFKTRMAAEQLAEVWPVIVRGKAPGLQVVQALVDWQNNLAQTISEGEKRINQLRNYHFASLPPGNPLMAKVPRSGQPASREKKGEPLSLESCKKREQSAGARWHLWARILPGFDPQANQALLPAEFAELAGSENSYLAVIHADGNNMGQVIRDLLQEMEEPAQTAAAQENYKNFCVRVDRATRDAFRVAVGKVMEKDGRHPLVPLICAGDDATLVIAAPKAMLFCREFASQFEIRSCELLAGMGFRCLANGLSTSIGAAFVKASHPFWQAYELAESLCAHAKQQTQRQGSAIAFHRVTTSLAGAYSSLLRESLSVADLCLTMNPYRLGGGPPRPGIPTFADLEQLCLALAGLPRGPVRELITRMHHSQAFADQAYERIKEVHSQGSPEQTKAFSSWEHTLQNLTASPAGASPLWQAPSQPGASPWRLRTPLLDAIELRAVETEFSPACGNPPTLKP